MSTSELAPTASNREEADDFRHVVAQINNDWRIIECRDGFQWILQRRAGQRHGQARWASQTHNRNKAALIANVRAFAGEIAPAAQTALDSLPTWKART